MGEEREKEREEEREKEEQQHESTELLASCDIRFEAATMALCAGGAECGT